MSRIALKANASGSGVFTIESPNSDTDRTLNLPDKAGTVQVGSGIDDNADATAITISSAEKVGINNANPSELLSIIGTGGTAKVRFDGDSSNLQNNFIGITGYDDLIIASDEANSGTASTIQFRVDAAEKMRILSGGGITFNGDTAAANALDDYEEGTWTPVMIGNGGTNPTVSYGNQTGYYVKVGKIVSVSWYSGALNISNAGSGDAYISGLPYASSTAVHHYPVCKVTFNTSTNHTCDGGYLYDGTMRLMRSGLSSSLTSWTSGSAQYLMIGAVYRTA